MNKFKLIAILVAASVLTACATTPAPVLVQQKVFVPPPDNLMQDCDIAPPPDKTAWTNAKQERDRTTMASSAYNDQTQKTQTCNARLGQLRTWVKQNTDVYNAKPSTN